jgi:hypothetical protein
MCQAGWIYLPTRILLYPFTCKCLQEVLYNKFSLSVQQQFLFLFFLFHIVLLAAIDRTSMHQVGVGGCVFLYLRKSTGSMLQIRSKFSHTHTAAPAVLVLVLLLVSYCFCLVEKIEAVCAKGSDSPILLSFTSVQPLHAKV